MSPAVAERLLLDRGSSRRIGRAGAFRRTPDSSDGGRLTLEARLDSVWEGLHADGAADCPVCGSTMTAAAAPGHAARCGTCRSRLR
jgi:hypothetical protein